MLQPVFPLCNQLHFQGGPFYDVGADQQTLTGAGSKGDTQDLEPGHT